jgi:transcriptional regulator with XRE-family HTH domain
MIVAKQFGENLRRERHAAEMTQEELSIRAGLHRTEIGMLERAIRLPRIDTLVKLAAALSIPPEQLLKDLAWEVPPERPKGRFSTGRPS